MNEQIEWVIVPKIPTQAMLDAELGLRHWDTKPSYESRRDLRPHIYAAMIAAAPQPPNIDTMAIKPRKPL